MYELLIAIIIVLFAIVKGREHFAVSVGGPKYVTLDTSYDQGRKVVSTTPDTCQDPNSEYEGGLCYQRCKPGYHGVGPVCWADTVGIGAGVPVGLEPCNPGWTNSGLTCNEPLRWNNCKFRGLFNECWGGLEGGRIQGRLNGGGICDHQDKGNLPDHLVDKTDPKNYIATHPDRVDGLCYKKCPPEKPNRVPGMPYLCMAGDTLSYGRGAGTVPGIFCIFGWCPF